MIQRLPKQHHPVILPHELFTNMISQINGGEFYSEFFGRLDIGYEADGAGAFLQLQKVNYYVGSHWMRCNWHFHSVMHSNHIHPCFVWVPLLRMSE